MANDVGTTHLLATARDTSRRICAQLLIDWDDTGFGDDTFIDANWNATESAYIQSVRGELEAVDWLSGPGAVGQGVANVCYVTLHNPIEDSGGYSGFRYSPNNPHGPLYAYIGEGKIFMRRAVVRMGIYYGAVPEYLRQITGYIVGITENYANHEVTFEIRDRAAQAAYGRHSTALYSDTKVSDYLQAVADHLDDEPANKLFDDGLIPLAYAWMDDETVWSEMQTIAECQIGRVWYDKDGDLHFDDGSHFVKHHTDTYDDPGTWQATLTTASFAALNPHYDSESIFNHIVIEYQPRYIATAQIVHTATEILSIPPLHSIHYDARFRGPVYTTPENYSGDTGAWRDTTTIVVTTAGGTDLTSSLSVFYSGNLAMYSPYVLSNLNASYTMFVVQFQISGTPVLGQEPAKYETEDPTSISAYGRRTLIMQTNPYITRLHHAQLVADFMLAKCKDPIGIATLTGVPALPWLEPGDRVRVTEANVGFDGAPYVDDFFIGRISWSWSPKEPYLMDIGLVRCQDVFAELATDSYPYFIIGTSVYGSGVGGGKLFW